MHLRVAHRQRGDTVIQCGDELTDYFTLGSRFESVFLDDVKSLCLTKSTSKGSLCCETGRAYSHRDFPRTVLLKVLPDHVPAFTIRTTEFTLEGELLVWKMPPIWSLGWPRTGITSDARQNRKAVIEGLTTRLWSARRNRIDPRKVTTQVPDWAKFALHQGEWVALVESVFPRVCV